MTRILKGSLTLGLLMAILTMVGGQANAQQPQIRWSVIGSGATVSTGPVTLFGTIGQTAVGTIEGSGKTAYLGFWVPFPTSSSAAPDEPKTGVASLRNYPNPFNTTTTIYFDVKQRSQARLRIFDMSGQLVSDLMDAVVEPGSQEVAWNGMTTSDQEAASGTYIYTLELQPTDGTAINAGMKQSGVMTLMR